MVCDPSITLFLKTLQCNSPVSVRFGRRAQGSKLFSSHTFDGTICPCRETRAKGASVPQGNAGRGQPLFGLKVATRPIPTRMLAGRLVCGHIPQPQLVLSGRFRGTEGHWRWLSILQWWEGCGMSEALKAWERMKCS